MSTVSRHDLALRLSRCSREGLAAVLEGAGVDTPEDADANALADRFVRQLWWRTHTPAGMVALPASLDRLVDRVARRLDLELPEGDAWRRLDALVTEVLPDGRVEALDQVDPAALERLSRRLGGAFAGVAGGAGAAGSHIAALKLLQWTRGPLWDLVPLLPKVGPVFTGIRAGASTVAKVSAPVGIALALFSLNQTFGAQDDKALPLLLGAGLLLREAEPVPETVEPVEQIEVPGDAVEVVDAAEVPAAEGAADGAADDAAEG
ncbi:MAG: hypothetical protein H6742_09180 [Alphaproteobacteria bacterium]|nr:hypothetical protein [Alphaproteobacteria bacterium]